MFKKTIKTLFAIVSTLAIVATSATAGAADWPEVIKVGLIPVEGGKDTMDRFQPMKDHLEKTLGLRVEFSTASDYAGVITAMEHKHIDFAYFGPKSYVEAANRANAQALALELSDAGTPGYYGIIITRKDSGIESLDEAISGKYSFSFTDPNSTSGMLVPSVLFARDLQQDPKQLFTEVSFSGSHGASMLAVKNKKIDVAATNDLDLKRMIEKGALAADEFNIIWRSELIPGSPMAGRADLPESLKAAFAGAMMSMNYNNEAIEKLQNGGYQPTADSDYDIIRYLKRLKKELKEKQG